MTVLLDVAPRLVYAFCVVLTQKSCSERLSCSRPVDRVWFVQLWNLLSHEEQRELHLRMIDCLYRREIAPESAVSVFMEKYTASYHFRWWSDESCVFRGRSCDPRWVTRRFLLARITKERNLVVTIEEIKYCLQALGMESSFRLAFEFLKLVTRGTYDFDIKGTRTGPRLKLILEQPEKNQPATAILV